MLIKDLLKGIEYSGTINPEDNIKDITSDSRVVEAEFVFVCIKGGMADGHDYAKTAINNGASYVIVEHDVGCEHQIVVKDSRHAYAIMCSNLCGNPSDKMKLIGITGTNGKTTITYLIKQILESAGKKVGLIGTIQNIIGDVVLPAKFTTPDPKDLHNLFKRMLNAGCEYVVMEVSSMALDQERVGGCHFETAVFTNLTQDHLDYHHTMENYYRCKRKLFDMCDRAVICIDDDYGKRLSSEIKCNQITISMNDNEADYTAHEIKNSVDGCRFALVGNGVIGRVSFSMPGKFSVSNALLAAGVAISSGIEFDQTIDSLNKCSGVKGRMEIIPCNKGFTIIRDFAHGPDALKNLLETVNECANGRVITLFGCAGRRDRDKRPQMGKIVAEHSDFIIFTADNPREEPMAQIADDTIPSIQEVGTPLYFEPDRYKAIRYALNMCQQGDVLVLAGKGHEEYQVLEYGTIYFDEKVIVNNLLKEME